MSKQKSITINIADLTEGERYGLEMMQIKAKLKALGITNIFTFFKVDYPDYDVDKFRAKINSRTTDKDFVDKLRSVYERQKH